MNNRTSIRIRMPMLSVLSSAAPLVVMLTSPVFAQDAILPQGDPRLRSTEEERARQEDIRDSRLKQQGQGSNYHIEGERQPLSGQGDTASGDPNGLARQDTGLADPTVNPGQASGMQRVQGRIVQSEAGRHVVRQLSGGDATLVVDARTAGDTDLQPGDIITGFITPQGRAVAIKKEPRSETTTRQTK